MGIKRDKLIEWDRFIKLKIADFNLIENEGLFQICTFKIGVYLIKCLFFLKNSKNSGILAVLCISG